MLFEINFLTHLLFVVNPIQNGSVLLMSPKIHGQCIVLFLFIIPHIRWFQYRLPHRIIPTNRYLYLIDVIDLDKCTVCGNHIETIDHLFCNCY